MYPADKLHFGDLSIVDTSVLWSFFVVLDVYFDDDDSDDDDDDSDDDHHDDMYLFIYFSTSSTLTDHV